MFHNFELSEIQMRWQSLRIRPHCWFLGPGQKIHPVVHYGAELTCSIPTNSYNVPVKWLHATAAGLITRSGSGTCYRQQENQVVHMYQKPKCLTYPMIPGQNLDQQHMRCIVHLEDTLHWPKVLWGALARCSTRYCLGSPYLRMLQSYTSSVIQTMS